MSQRRGGAKNMVNKTLAQPNVPGLWSYKGAGALTNRKWKMIRVEQIGDVFVSGDCRCSDMPGDYILYKAEQDAKATTASNPTAKNKQGAPN